MRQADQPAGDTLPVGDITGPTSNTERRLAGGRAYDLDVGPGDTVRPAGPERFESGFLGGEANGKMLVYTAGVREGIITLRCRKDTAEEAIAVLGPEVGNASNGREVSAEPNRYTRPDHVPDDFFGLAAVGDDSLALPDGLTPPPLLPSDVPPDAFLSFEPSALPSGAGFLSFSAAFL